MVEERVPYFALVEDGVGSREAARRVGVNYRTAKQWRAAAAAAAAAAVDAAVAAAPPVVSPRFLSLEERIRIADRVREPGISLRAIAAELGRPVSTITRELHRNQHPDGTYQPHAAHEQAATRRARPKVSKLTADPALRAIVQHGLDTRWSPQQIVRRLSRPSCTPPPAAVSARQ
ncbi:transposase [Amycolatopsis sp. NPDC004747]